MTRTYQDDLGYALFMLIGWLQVAIVLSVIIIGLIWED